MTLADVQYGITNDSVYLARAVLIARCIINEIDKEQEKVK